MGTIIMIALVIVAFIAWHTGVSFGEMIGNGINNITGR